MEETKANNQDSDRRFQSFTDSVVPNLISEDVQCDSSEDEPVLNPEVEIVQASMDLREAIHQKRESKPPEYSWSKKSLKFPSENHKVKIYAITWNMYGKYPPDNISCLFPAHADHHIYIVCTQECLRSIGTSLFYSSKRPWENKLQECLGSQYLPYASHTIGATHIAIFINSNMNGVISDPEMRKISTGFGNVVNNKGAVGVKFNIGDTSFLVVGCHLTSGQNEVNSRNNDFYRIEKELFKDFSSEPASDSFDVCIYLGDMNYRINGPRFDVEKLIESNRMEPLHKGDQLLKEMLRNPIFAGFREGPLSFIPTYRYDVGTDKFDTSKKQRVPSWTDRIIYKSKRFILKQKTYSSLDTSLTSDHRAVFSQFVLKFEPKKETITKQSKSRTCFIF